MAALSVNKSLSFNELKETLQITDGNLASHIKILEENNYVSVMKGFIGRKTNTLYAVTTVGKKAFKQHLNALAQMIDTVSD
jgi:DNA-binding MarR family transcriptional regulator